MNFFIMYPTTVAVLLGVALDFVFGDPRCIPHPVVMMGKLIDYIEKKYRDKKPCDSDAGKRKAGTILWITVVASVIAASGIILYISYRISIYLYLIVCSIMCYQCMASKSLRTESMKVYKSIGAGDLEKARFDVSMIVGRDTNVLDENGIIKATVETVAENTSDGCVAPLFFMAIGGPVLGMIYKAVNTMDSMVGYKNDKYLYYGRFAAKMDDFFNYIPARISAINMIIAAYLLRMDYKSAFRIFVRDRYKSTSPNSGQSEAACAGALGLELLGDAVYFGKVVHKDTMGDAVRPIENEDIKRANRLMYATVIVSTILMIGIRILIIRFAKGATL